ncbi:MAG: glycoside hydrolase [Dysgonamonadaceae bacterium]|jgi:chitinase|nr:glycoside hydrolase [Dysgonamonadaceae bacterium]
MKNIFIVLFLLSIAFSCSKKEEDKCEEGQTTQEQPVEITEDNSKIVIAYVTAWSSAMPDPDFVTHINYSFGHVNETYNGVNIDNADRLKSIVELKKKKSSLKILLSIGGWGSGRFCEMAMTESNRNGFVSDCKRIVDEFGLDGIDMDWEYPTSNAAGISSSPEDTENFNLLMQEIRKGIGDDKLLTLASAATGQYYDFETLAEIVDFVNIMMYDTGVPPYHHSALHRSEGSGNISADESIDKHLLAGMPAKKLVLGIPFYGHGDTKIIPYFIDYKDIIKLQGFTEKWDDVALVPYLENSAGEIVCVYENARSIAFKCEYLLKRQLKGAMYWEYSCDDTQGTLRKAVWDGIMKKM